MLVSAPKVRGCVRKKETAVFFFFLFLLFTYLKPNHEQRNQHRRPTRGIVLLKQSSFRAQHGPAECPRDELESRHRYGSGCREPRHFEITRRLPRPFGRQSAVCHHRRPRSSYSRWNLLCDSFDVRANYVQCSLRIELFCLIS